eukprot:SAG11_NODE_8459_length_1013_cov_0.764770_1_plen_111_part_00
MVGLPVPGILVNVYKQYRSVLNRGRPVLKRGTSYPFRVKYCPSDFPKIETAKKIQIVLLFFFFIKKNTQKKNRKTLLRPVLESARHAEHDSLLIGTKSSTVTAVPKAGML